VYIPALRRQKSSEETAGCPNWARFAVSTGMCVVIVGKLRSAQRSKANQFDGETI
jgi:hypothetical protein